MSAIAYERSRTNLREVRSGPGMRVWASLIGGIALTALADRQVTRMVWPENGTHVSDEDSDIVVLGGIGEMGGHRVRDVLAESVDAPMCAVQYCNRGISRLKLGRAFTEYYGRSRWNGERRQTLVTHSMGLPLGLNAVAEAVDSGIKVPEIAEIHSISSPTCAEDTHKESALKVLRHMPEGVAGITTKLSVGWVYALERARDRAPEGSYPYTPPSLLRAARETLGEVRDQLAPPTWFTMARELGKAGPHRDGIFDGIITPETKIFYYYDRDDRVVKTETALGRLSMLAERYGASLYPEETPGVGHANIEAVSPVIAKNMSV